MAFTHEMRLEVSDHARTMMVALYEIYRQHVTSVRQASESAVQMQWSLWASATKSSGTCWRSCTLWSLYSMPTQRTSRRHNKRLPLTPECDQERSGPALSAPTPAARAYQARDAPRWSAALE